MNIRSVSREAGRDKRHRGMRPPANVLLHWLIYTSPLWAPLVVALLASDASAPDRSLAMFLAAIAGIGLSAVLIFNAARYRGEQD